MQPVPVMHRRRLLTVCDEQATVLTAKSHQAITTRSPDDPASAAFAFETRPTGWYVQPPTLHKFRGPATMHPRLTCCI